MGKMSPVALVIWLMNMIYVREVIADKKASIKASFEEIGFGIGAFTCMAPRFLPIKSHALSIAPYSWVGLGVTLK